jgi:hypothetical protein
MSSRRKKLHLKSPVDTACERTATAVFDTVYLSPRISTAQIQIIEAALLRLKHTAEWRAWLAQPGVGESSRGWYFEDHPTRRIARAKSGANAHFAFSEIEHAHARGQLAQWVVDQAYIYADQVSNILAVQKPARSQQYPPSTASGERPS